MRLTCCEKKETTMRNFLKLLSLSLAAVLVASPLWSAPGGKKIKVLIVTGHDVGAHNWRATTPVERANLEKTGRFEVRVCEDYGIFESSAINKYDVIVLNYGFWHVPDPPPHAKKNLLDFVRNGKGLVGLHFSSSSFQSWREYGDLLGRRWVRGVSGHGPRLTFTVKITKPDHPIMKGISDFQVNDELYSKLQGDVPITVLASAYSDFSKKVEPLIFVLKYGKGRVARNVLGHDAAVRKNPNYQRIVARQVEWAATGKVTLP